MLLQLIFKHRPCLLFAFDDKEFQVNDRRTFEELVGLGVRNNILLLLLPSLTENDFVRSE